MTSTIRIRRSVATVAIALAGLGIAAVSVTACSSQSSTPAEPSAAASPGPIGGNVLPPVMVEPGQTEASAKVGDTIVFNVPADQLTGTTISTDQPNLLELSQAKQEGDALFNPGAKALAAGTAVVTITSPNSTTSTVTITISE